MFDKDYKDAMDNVPFSADFEKRTMEQLEQALMSAPPAKPEQKRRRWIVPAALLTAAATLALTIGLRAQVFSPEAMQVNIAPQVDMAAQVTGIASSADTMPTALAPGAEVTLNAQEYEAFDYEDDADGAMTLPYPAPGNPSNQIAPNRSQLYDQDTSEYNYLPENGFKDVAIEPLSTFAADVDTASYANVRKMLTQGQPVPPDAVRIEEFINYFRYDYPEPNPEDNRPFSITTEIAPCPWNDAARLLMVGLQAKKLDTDSLPASNLVFLIDVSGSMDEPDKLPLVQRAFSMLAEQLGPEDTVSIVTYAGSDDILLDGASGRDKPRMMEAIGSLMAGGSTNGASGIETAYQLAQKHFIPSGNNRVILATDGDLNVGISSEGDLTRLIERKKQGGVFLSVMGFGAGNLKDNKLEALADHGNGNYSYVGSVLEARKVLVEEIGATFFTVAKDVKLQLEFNPAKVKSYRLVGYENRVMAAQDFADDKKDGGEIGAGHSVTALYELILQDGDAKTGSDLRYQQTWLKDSTEYLTVSVRSKLPDADDSTQTSHNVRPDDLRETMSDNMAFAAAVAEVAMTLKDSEHKGTSSYASASALLSGIPNLVSDPYKDEFAYLVRQLARSDVKLPAHD